MGKTLADAMSAQPGPDSLAYWLAPLKGYWDRQGRHANEGLQMAEQGANNYVVFDDSIIDILKRYGIPMTAGVGGAMVVSGQNMPEDLAAQMGPQG